MAVDNATAGCASDSQAGNLNKELPIRECMSGPLVPEKLAAQIRQGEFIEICELILEYKVERQCPRRVLAIFT